jgi:hypothetical protein
MGATLKRLQIGCQLKTNAFALFQAKTLNPKHLKGAEPRYGSLFTSNFMNREAATDSGLRSANISA